MYKIVDILERKTVAENLTQDDADRKAKSWNEEAGVVKYAVLAQ